MRREMDDAGKGNIRWARAHWLKSQLVSGNKDVLIELRKCAAEWNHLDPESATLAAMLCAQHIHNERRRTQTLRGLYDNAKRHNLGDLMNQIKALMLVLFMVLGTGDFLIYRDKQL